MIYTSYYANYRALQQNGITMIRISLGNPKVPVALTLPVLYPPGHLWGVEPSLFREGYLAVLSQRIALPALFLQQLQALEQRYGSVALCCFEALKTPDERCHRQLVALWLKQNTGYELVEFQKPSQQRELF